MMTAVLLAASGSMGAAAQGYTTEKVLDPADSSPGQSLFGWSVAINGPTALVGAPRDDDAGLDAGAIYLFNSRSGNQTAKIIPADTVAGDWFGFSISSSENFALVGAPRDDDGASDAGSAYVYDLRSENQLAKLTAPNAVADAAFGISVAVSGGVGLIGVRGDAHNGINDTGSAYLFDLMTNNQLAKLTATDLSSGSLFGRSVAISGNRALVGAPRDASPVRSGAAYLFDTTSGDQVFKLTPSDAAINDSFGWSVALNDKWAVIGAPEKSGFDGSAYVFDVDTGAQLFKLSPSDATDQLQFGRFVAISDNKILIGANGENYPGPMSGSAYLFDANTGMQLAKITPSDSNTYHEFGWSGAIEGGTAIIGSYNRGVPSADAFIFIPEPSCLSLIVSPLLMLVDRRRCLLPH
jgi:hypothetical protein